MDCNKDEAARAKEIAEKKFNANDIMGAKKFALKAQSLYPVLDGIQQMIATLDVYISAEEKINGEPDLYKILGALPQETDDEIRRKYKRLALILHPDKNKSIGAEGAFQLISEACKLLCDKVNRSHYDQRRTYEASKRKSAPANGFPSAPPNSNGNHNAARKTTPAKKKKSTKSKAKVGADTRPSHAKSLSTFWTICLRCNLQYEYPREYLDNNILCRKCQEPFFAAEAPPPAENGAKASTQMNDPQKSQGVSKNVSGAGRKKPSTPNAGSGGFCSQISPTSTTYYWDPHSKTGEGASKIPTASVEVKRKHEDLKAGKKTDESLLKHTGDLKRGKGIDDHGTLKKSVDTVMKTGTETASFPRVETGGSEPNKESGAKNGSSEPNKASGVKKGKSVDDHAPVKPSKDTAIKTGTSATGLSGLKNGGSEPSKASGVKKRKSVDDYYAPVKPSRDTTIKTGTAAATLSGLKNCSSEPNKTNGFKKQKITHAESQNLLAAKARMEILTKLAHWKSNSIPESSVAVKVTDSVMADEAAATVKKNPLLMDVPDAEFHDFDKARTGKCFAENEVWTAYDADDGMPRLYAMVHKVISRNPFKMRMSWLNSKTNSELGPLNWVGSGFSKTCGDFWIGKHETDESLNSFSHKVRWNKGARGTIRIFPAKGDVWALYRNWSPDWNELTADEVIHKYDMVKVLEDYDEESGITVTPLVKVAGFKTVFHQHMDLKEVRRIPREEIFRFSHHVPSRMLSGQEAPNAPKGCIELDPAATPEELLRVIKDITEEDIAETEEKAKIGNDVGGSA